MPRVRKMNKKYKKALDEIVRHYKIETPKYHAPETLPFVVEYGIPDTIYVIYVDDDGEKLIAMTLSEYENYERKLQDSSRK